MATATNHERGNALDRAAYMTGRDDARAGLERFPQCQHPDQYGAYNAGFHDWHKLASFPAMLAALHVFINESEIHNVLPATRMAARSLVRDLGEPGFSTIAPPTSETEQASPTVGISAGRYTLAPRKDGRAFILTGHVGPGRPTLTRRGIFEEELAAAFEALDQDSDGEG